MNAKSTHVRMAANVLMKDLVTSASANLDLMGKIVKMVFAFSFYIKSFIAFSYYIESEFFILYSHSLVRSYIIIHQCIVFMAP